MTINKEQLIFLLIEKTGLEPEQVKSQFSELINRIQQAAEEGKTFEIEGFGVFSMDEGTLQFEPSDTLETEINNKYAGMKPIELIGAFKEPEGDEDSEISEEEQEKEENRWTFDEAAMEEESEEPVSRKTESEEARDLVEKFEEKQKQKSSKKEAETEDDVDEVFGTEPQKVESGKPIKEKPALQQEKSLQKVEEKIGTKKETDTLGRYLVAAVVVISLGVSGWLIYDTGFSVENNAGQEVPEASAQPTTISDRQVEDTGQESSQDSQSQRKGDDEISEPEQAKEVVKQEGSRSNRQEQQNKFGLQGEFNQSIGGYTIVVHSLRSIQKAENNRQNLEDAGYRTLINEAEVGGTTYYRVGIGQFETVNDALQAVKQLPSRFREDNFIKRIQ